MITRRTTKQQITIRLRIISRVVRKGAAQDQTFECVLFWADFVFEQILYLSRLCIWADFVF